jgi:hypothetical protein
MFRHYIAIFRMRFQCLLRDAHAHHVTRHNTPIHNILSTAPQVNICQKALGTLPEDGNIMPKHVGATIHNQSVMNNWCICWLFTHFYWEFYFLKGSLRDVFKSLSALKG